MNKKRLICLVASVVLAASLVACDTMPDKTEILPSEENLTQSQQNDSNHVPPADGLEFDTMAEVKQFLDLSDNSNNSSLEDSTIKNVCQYYSQNEAASISGIADALLFPVAGADVGVRYVPDTHYLDIAYVIDEVQYRFFYTLDASCEWEFTETPVALDVPVGPYKIDFARRDHARAEDQFFSSFDMNGICVEIWVTGDGIDTPSFEAFEFVPLSSIGGDEVA